MAATDDARPSSGSSPASSRPAERRSATTAAASASTCRPRRSATRSSASSTCTRSRSSTTRPSSARSTLDLAAMLFATGPRRRALDDLLPAPRDGARRGGVAPLGRDELRPVGPHDAVQGEVGEQGVRLGRPLHVPGADGGRHPALPDRPRPDRRRPAAAPRARPRRRRALQLPLRRDVPRPRRAVPRDRRADHGSPGADEQDVDVDVVASRAPCTSPTRPTRSARSSRRR